MALHRPRSERVRTNLDQVTRKIESLTREIDRLRTDAASANDPDRARLLAAVEAAERELQMLRARANDWAQRLDAERLMIAGRLQVGRKCRERREDVAGIFAAAKSSLRSESDEALRPAATELAGRIEAEEPGHREAIDNAIRAIETCEQMLR